MTSLLPPLLTPADFSPAELSALRLDGEAVDIAGALSPFGVNNTASRALALDVLRLHGTVIERRSALWVHGVLAVVPHPIQLAIPRDRRVHPVTSNGCEYRVIALKPQHIVRVAGVPVTSPARTLFDVLAVPRQPEPRILEACETLVSQQPQCLAAAVAIARLASGTQHTLRAIHHLRNLGQLCLGDSD